MPLVLISVIRNCFSNEKFVEALKEVLSNPPPGFFPKDKLLRTIDTVRKS